MYQRIIFFAFLAVRLLGHFVFKKQFNGQDFSHSPFTPSFYSLAIFKNKAKHKLIRKCNSNHKLVRRYNGNHKLMKEV